MLLQERPVRSVELRLTNTIEHGFWDGLIHRVEHVSWLDERTIVTWSTTGTIRCVDVKNGEEKWSIPKIYQVDQWSLTRETRRLAVLHKNSIERFAGDDVLLIVDVGSGKTIQTWTEDKLAKTLGLRHLIIKSIALSQVEPKLIVTNFSTYFGRNAYVLNMDSGKLAASFEIDTRMRELTVTDDGRYATTIADKKVLCVREIKDNREIHFEGERTLTEPKTMSFTIGPAFQSHARYDGHQRLVVAVDGGCFGKGKIEVRNFANKDKIVFDSHNQHNEIDVDFAKNRIAVTGTSTGLTLFSFDGKTLAEVESVQGGRKSDVAFSPSGEQIAIAGEDNSVTIFAVEE